MNFIASLKSNIRLYQLRKKFPKSVIHSGVIMDKESMLGEYSVLFKNVTLIDSNIGAFSYVQSGTTILCADIGKFCSIANGVNIDLIDHPMNMVSTSPVFYEKSQPLPKFLINNSVYTTSIPRTKISADVWIGQGAKIRAGVHIGVGSVIGAGSIVTKDIPAYSIAVGNPCRPIKQRFSANISERLLSSKWWDFEEEKLKRLAPLFYDPVSFLNELER